MLHLCQYRQESFLKAGSSQKALEKEVENSIILGCRSSISDLLLKGCQQEHCARKFWYTDSRSGKLGTWRSIQTSMKTEKVVTAPKTMRAAVSGLKVSNTRKSGIAVDGGWKIFVLEVCEDNCSLCSCNERFSADLYLQREHDEASGCTLGRMPKEGDGCGKNQEPHACVARQPCRWLLLTSGDASPMDVSIMLRQHCVGPCLFS